MILNGKKMYELVSTLGYLKETYAMDIDPDFTFQEFLLINFLRKIGWQMDNFDTGILSFSNLEEERKNYYIKRWNEEFLGSVKNPPIINKPWDKVLKDKNGIVLNKNKRKILF